MQLKILMIGDRAWGRGDTLTEAARNLKKSGGDPRWSITYVVHPDTTVSELGNLCYPREHPPQEIDRRAPKKAKRQ